MNEITTIIFSKNRACQLELLLRNLNMPASVLYTYDPDFKAGYEKLIKMYPAINFVLETDFKKQVIDMLGEYTMFLVDDDIMIEHFDINCLEFKEFKKYKDILCLSLRLAPYYKKCPKLVNNTWEHKPIIRGDWGYPMSVTSNIFRKEDILPIIQKEEITNPNNLEVKLRRNTPNIPFMKCFDTPKFINNIANQVQFRYRNPNVVGVSVKYLEEEFLKGRILSLSHIQEKAKESDCCFLATQYEWVNDWLKNYKKNVYSQRGEDGVLKKIFEILGIKKGFCVDVGAYGQRLSNTCYLLKQGWSGILIDKDIESVQRLGGICNNDNVSCACVEIQTKGVNTIDNFLKGHSVYLKPIPRDFDFLSIDIDGNDYYVWKDLTSFTPKVVVIEFNSTYVFEDYLQEIDGKGGSSLSKIVELGKEKGYELITTTNFNAFFVRKDLFKQFEISNNCIQELFVKNKDTYGK